MKKSHGEGTIYKKPDGKHRAQVSVGGQRLSHTGSQRECEAWMRKMRGQIEKGMTWPGAKVTMGELKVDQRSGTEEELVALGLSPGMPILHVSWVIRAEGNPAAFLVDILPGDVLNLEELKDRFTGSVLDLLLRKGTPVLASSRTEISAVSASPEVARALGIQRGDVLLKFTAYLYDTHGRVVDYSFSHFLPGYFKFHVVRRVG